jgi:mRNA interferase HigB
MIGPSSAVRIGWTLAPTMGAEYVLLMRIIAKRTLRRFWETHPRGAEAEAPLQVWHSTVEAANWATPADVKASYGDASIVKNSRVVFNIAGNKFRLVTRINYPYRVVYVRFVGTHEEYDDIQAEAI